MTNGWKNTGRNKNENRDGSFFVEVSRDGTPGGTSDGEMPTPHKTYSPAMAAPSAWICFKWSGPTKLSA